MSKFRLPLWTLLASVLLFGVGLGALKNPSVLLASAIFTLAVLSLSVTPVVAVASFGRGRLAWLTFTQVGAAYLGLTFFGQVVPTPRFAPSGWVAAGLNRLEGIMDANQPDSDGLNDIQPVQGFIYPGPGTVSVSSVQQSAESIRMQKQTEFRQIGHSLTTLGFGPVAAIIVLLIPAPKRADTHASGRP